MNILLLGRDGQVGWELQRSLAPLGRIVAPARNETGGLCGDLERPDALCRSIRELRPDVIVNAAAYTAVDMAESDRARAERVNADAPAAIAAEAAELDTLLVHYSTDYVFDGHGSEPWREDAPAAPLNAYGSSKWRGEEAIRQSGCRHLVFRTGWVYATRRRNFVRTMLRLASERDELRVVDDQIGAPTGAELIADATAHALRSVAAGGAPAGTYHLSAAGETSWYGFARFIIDVARQHGWPVRVADGAIVPVSSSDYAAPARRPRNSRLAVDKLERNFGLRMPDWRTGSRRALLELIGERGREPSA